MRFLGGFLKFLSIFLLLIATAACTAASIYVGTTEIYWVMGLCWVGILLVALNILGTGIALTQVAKLKKKVRQLEERVYAAPAAAPAYHAPVQQNVQPELQEPVYQPPMPEEAVPAPAPAPAAKRSKVWIPIVVVALVAVIAIVAVIAVTSLGKPQEAPEHLDEDRDNETHSAHEPEENEPDTCAMQIDGICVDDSFVAEDGSSLKMVYLFYTLTAQDTNLSIDSKYTTMYIGDNAYESDHYADTAAACKYTPNYYYSSYIKDVYVGESVKVVATFYIPAAELESGKDVTFADHQIPGIENVTMNVSDFMHYGSPEDIAYNMDNEGLERIMYMLEPADDATVQLVSSQLNGYYWTFYVNNVSYKLEFWAPNNFSLTTAFGTQYGTYTVQNGYVFCTYTNTGHTVEIPYEIVDGELDLDTIDGFDVMG